MTAHADSLDRNARRPLGEIFQKWLVLAVVYNGVLLTLTVAGSSAMAGVSWMSAEVFSAYGMLAVMANLCFLAAPGLDLTAHHFGWRSTGFRRMALFLPGLIFAMGLTSCAVSAMSFVAHSPCGGF